VPDEPSDVAPPDAAAFDLAAVESDDEPDSTLADASPAPDEVNAEDSEPVVEALDPAAVVGSTAADSSAAAPVPWEVSP